MAEIESELTQRLLERIEQAVTPPPPAGLPTAGAAAGTADAGAALPGADSQLLEIEAPGRELLARGGKRWRPLLLALTCRLCGGPEAAALALAPVVELAHTGSLIIDDIEDGADLRRGAPAAHLRHGLDLAINAGNLLYFLPERCIAAAGLDPATELQVYRLYLRAMLPLHYGQGLDILWHRQPDRIPAVAEYLAMCRAKSGSLAGLATSLGAVLAAAPARHTRLLHHAGEEFGVCFQIIDDVRNLTTGNPGKRRGDDLLEGKKSLPVILYCNRGAAARERLVQRLEACMDAAAAPTAAAPAAAAAVEETIALLQQAGVIEEARALARASYRRVMGGLEREPQLARGDAWAALQAVTGALIG